MSSVFADTSFYIALANPKDAWHQAATRAGDQSHGTVLTTEYVLLELGNYLCAPSDRQLFLRLIEMLRKDPKTTIVSASSELLEAGLQLYAGRPDKWWSLTDCISFCVMERHGIKDALSCDHHFAQAGFQLLLTK